MDFTNLYAARRQKIFEALPNNSAMLLPANAKIIRNGDAHYAFRQDSNFYYVSGFTEDNALLVLLKTDEGNQFIVFCQETSELEARWQGARLGAQGAMHALGAHQAYPYSELEKKLPEIVEKIEIFYYSNNPINPIMKMKGESRDPGLILNELRLIKDAHEIDLMRKAAQISVQAHIRAMKACKANLFEYELEAEYLYDFTRLGAKSPAYTSIVGAGANACILHYIDNQSILRDGDLVLVDAGAEYQCYASDITRVFPVNGRFSEPQKIIYELVLKAQLAAIDLARPHHSFDEMQAVVVKILTQGLMQLGIITNEQDYIKYYMHKSGHWLGLDVHDVGNYQIQGVSRLLNPGMVLTVEPGLYFPLDCLEIAQQWRGIGVRIEDDILVTNNEPEVLSGELPKTIQAIEALMQN